MSRTLATLTAVLGLFIVGATAPTAHAQKACEYLVPPHGGAYEVPVHPAYVTSLRFAGKIASANTSAAMDKDYEIRADGPDGLLVRPKARSPGDANINIQVGPSRISALLRTLRDPKEACALVTFKATTIEEALERQVADAVAKRTAALEAELAALREEQSARVAAAIAETIAERAMTRLELQRLKAVARNDAGVVVWVLRAVVLGPDLLINVEIENRSGVALRVADLDVRDGAGKARGTAARLAGATPAGGVLGTVAPGAKVRGVALVRDGAALAGAALTLSVRTTDGKREVTVRDLGIR
ncbi:MAG: DUF2381 family protein [Kofleriaceae bacterium]|jgi:hypothetical protein|nr:DUF2381 family protein [Kofleriaceae bacterium]MBP9168308.1 DUF2381 family protein [Kofleriaceae bacterium]MBP9857187.1 DUF2381 family protein [Kofleriaceae bacterium]